MGSSAKEHVVVIPYPAQGHVPPLMYLAKKLAELDCTVTVANVTCIHEQLTKSWSFSPELDISLAALQPSLEMPRGALTAAKEDIMAFTKAIASLGGEFEALLRKLVHKGPISCIISDHYVGSWPVSIASKFGIPHATYWPGSVTWLSVEYHLPLLHSKGDVPINGGEDHLISYVPGTGSFKRSQLPPEYVAANLPYQLEGAKRLRMNTWVLCNSLYEIEPEAVDAMQEIFKGQLVPIGPLFDPAMAENEFAAFSLIKEDRRTCIEWLDKQKPGSVIYAAFGSIASLTRTQFEELALGLESTGLCFLLTLRREIVDELCEKFLSDFRERTKDRSLVVCWSPQREVLKHVAVATFLTHCGWNSCMEGGCRGVPMVCWPFMYDQLLNSKVLSDSKLGVELERNSVGIVEPDEVRNVVRCVHASEEMKHRASRLKETALNTLHSRDERLKWFLQAVRK